MAELLETQTPVEDAARVVAFWLTELVGRTGSARLGIPGGSALTALARVKALVPSEVWKAVKLTWVDERVVPVASGDSNRGAAERSGVLEGLGDVLPLVLDDEDGPAACARFSEAFERSFDGTLDVALLGMGEDGHVASLFPGHRLLDATGLVAHLEDSPKPPPARVTMTLSVLQRPEMKRLVLAAGAGKRDALTKLLAKDQALPATLLGELTLVTDQRLT